MGGVELVAEVGSQEVVGVPLYLKNFITQMGGSWSGDLFKWLSADKLEYA